MRFPRWPVPAHSQARRIRLLGLALLIELTTSPCVSSAQSRPRTTLQLVPVTRISAEEHDLSSIGRIARGPDGTIWVSQDQDGNVVAFSSAGRRLRAVGRKGAGPGEFQSAGRLHDDGKGLVVYDFILQRVAAFRPDGVPRSTQRVGKSGTVTPRATVVEANDQRVVWIERPSGPRSASDGASTPRPVTLFVSSITGSGFAKVVAVDELPCSLSIERDGGSASVGIPFCHHTKHATAPNLKYHAFATPVAVESGSTGFDLLVVSSRGDTVTRSRHLLGRSMIADRLRDSVIKAFSARPFHPQLTAEIVRGDLIPRTYPPVTDIAVSDDGDAWVTVRSGPTGTTGLLVVRRGGVELGYTPMPRTSSARWVGKDESLIVEEDPDGLQDLVLYKVRRQ